MGTFELEHDRIARGKIEDVRNLESCSKKEECIIAFKVYDHCRQQYCNNVLHTFRFRQALSESQYFFRIWKIQI